jgi:hypothetical protein
MALGIGALACIAIQLDKVAAIGAGDLVKIATNALDPVAEPLVEIVSPDSPGYQEKSKAKGEAPGRSSPIPGPSSGTFPSVSIAQLP